MEKPILLPVITDTGLYFACIMQPNLYYIYCDSPRFKLAF